jgi:hypothetical protein
MGAIACVPARNWRFEPKVKEFGEAKASDIGRFIVATNVYRRHLTRDRQIMICAKANRWIAAAIGAQHKLEVQQRHGAHGKKGGRGHKKPWT